MATAEISLNATLPDQWESQDGVEPGQFWIDIKWNNALYLIVELDNGRLQAFNVANGKRYCEHNKHPFADDQDDFKLVTAPFTVAPNK